MQTLPHVFGEAFVDRPVNKVVSEEESGAVTHEQIARGWRGGDAEDSLESRTVDSPTEDRGFP
jgi:hypothetical protein